MPSLGTLVGTRRISWLDLGVVEQLLDALGGVDHLDDARQVVSQSVMHGLAAQDLIEFLVGGLGLGRGHAVGGIQARQRANGIDAGVRAFDEVLPAALLEEGELHVAPRLNMFGHELPVLLGGELADFLAGAVHHTDLAVVEVYLVLLVHHAHVAGLMGEGVAGDHLHVIRVAEHDLLEHRQRPFGKLHAVLGQFLELGQVLGLERLTDAAGEAEHGVHDLAAEVGD